MKKLFSLVLTCLIVTFIAIFPTFADSSLPLDFNDVFSALGTSDGAESEQVASELVSLFDLDSEGFICEVSLLSEDKIEEAANLLVYGKSYFDLDEFSTEIDALATRKEWSEKERLVLTKIKDEISYLIWFNSVDLSDGTYIEHAPAFDKDTILNFIDLNSKSKNVDEEFFSILGQAYRADPEYFSEVVSSLPAGKIETVVNAVAYDCVKTQNTDIQYFQTNNALIDRIVSRIKEYNNGANLNVFYEYKLDTHDSVTRSTAVPTIGTMTYTSGTIEVGTAENLQVTFSESRNTASTRTYWTEIYAVRDGTPWLKTSKSITIPAGSTSVNVNYTIDFSDVGAYYTIVKVYSSRNGTLLASRQGSYPDYSYGKWSISIALPANRYNFGTLSLYKANGVQVMSCQCLGLAASNAPMNVYEGNTPTGVYEGYLSYHGGTTNAYGPYQVVILNGKSGIIISSGRSGIWIHGGAPASASSATYPLRPTNGCVRVSNANQLNIQNSITSLTSSSGYHKTIGDVNIYEY